jgi:hypothetical protein
VLAVVASCVAFLLAATALAATPYHVPDRAPAAPRYDAGVARFEVVDESQPFDILHGILEHPRILVGVVYYPIARRAGGRTPITLAYYHDAPEYESYSRTIEWYFKIPSMSADDILGMFGGSVEAHLSTERSGIYADAPIAQGRFPVVVQFNGSAGRGHQGDDVGGRFAQRGYIYVALDAPGVSSLTPVGRVGLDAHHDLAAALSALPPCQATSPVEPPLCFNKTHGEYGVADDGGILWALPVSRWETYVEQRARDAVAMLKRLRQVFRGRADTQRVGIVGISLGAPAAFAAPQLIDALRHVRGDRYAAYAIVPTPFGVNMVGEDAYGYTFGSQIGEILCGRARHCDPLEAARRFDFPVGIHIAEEDRLIIGSPPPSDPPPPEWAPSAEWTFHLYYPGYPDAPSPENRAPANRILFDSISHGVPALWVQVPDADHIDFISSPLYRLFDDFFFLPYRVFSPYEPYEPLPMALQQEILAHYSTAFFDLTLKGKMSALKALKTDRFRELTPDGRGVEVEAKSLTSRKVRPSRDR